MQNAYALLSVSDKTGLISFAQGLAKLGYQLLATGGTLKALQDARLEVIEVASLTGFPEIMDGRVKTLHPKIHGGILAKRGDQNHQAAMAQHMIPKIDIVVVNLYPFRETVAAGGNFAECVENIDIGGPAMIRAAAKNQADVLVVTDPEDYEAVLAALQHSNGVDETYRRQLAAKAYSHTGAYDAVISRWFYDQLGEAYPQTLVWAAEKQQDLRYGENPHQSAAMYKLDTTRPTRTGIVTAEQLQGKELSYNNINDTHAALELVAEFTEPSVAIIKHANPCGVASGKDLMSAYQLALRCDPTSAFGGIIAINRPLDGAFVQALGALFLEVIVAPSVTDEAMALLEKKKNLRVLTTGKMPDVHAPGRQIMGVAGGFLVQSRDNGTIVPDALKVVTARVPTAEEMQDLQFAWRVAKHVKSNAIVYARGGATVGIGAGQMSRVDSARIAAHKAEEAAKTAGMVESLTKGCVVASDAFFPFADGLLAAIAAGATAVIQPGGSVRDQEVIDAANAHGIAMVFTGMRHFRH